MSGKTKLVIKNTAIQTASQLVTWTMTWVLLSVLPRFLGDANFGKLFFAFSYCAIFGTFINFGMNTFLVREMAVLSGDKDGEAENGLAQGRHLLSNLFALKLAMAAVAYLLMCLVILLLPYDAITRQAVFIVGAVTCLTSLTMALGSAFQGMQSMVIPNLAVISEKAIVTGGACLALVYFKFSVLEVCWVYLAGALVNFVLTYVFLQRRICFGLSLDGVWVRRILLGSVPFLIWVVFGEIYVRIDVLMLSLMTNDAVVGWYGVAFRLYGAILFVPMIFNTAIFPALAKMGGGKAEVGADFARATRRLMNLMLVVSVPIAAGIIMVADPILLQLYGPGSYLNAGPCLKLLGFSVLIMCLDVLLGSVLISRGLEKPWSYMAIAAAFFNPALNAFLIPMTQKAYGNGGIGAATATVLTEVLMMCGALYLFPRGILAKQNLVVALKAVAVAALMMMLLQWLDLANLVLMVVLGAGFYGVVALLVGVMPGEDLAHLKHAVLSRTRRQK
jgi:O-antigen/teichoic acid export membrane protein